MNFIDSVVGYISPKAGANRVQNRARMEAMKMQVRRYEGAADGRRHSNWLMKSNPSVNQLINKDLKNLVSRSRELSINNPYARKAPYSIANSVVGTGIIPRAQFVKQVIGGKLQTIPGEDKLIEMISAAWKEWAEYLSCDYNGDFDFYGLQYLVMRTIVTSGEVLAIRKRVTTDVNKYGFQILILEGDFIDGSKNNDKDPDGGYTQYGIKYDKNFKRSGYWIFDRHPSESNPTSIFVPIADVIHVFDVERTGQNRGVPAASSTLLKQRDLDDYEDAELLGKKVSACMPIFVTNSDPEAKENETVESIEPGAINYLNGGESVTFATPPANNGFVDFTRTQHRAIAAGYLLTYEMLTGDMSSVNFSSGRMGWIEFQRQVYNWQYLMLIPKFCDKAYQWFAESLQIVQGLNKELKVKPSWTAPRREMIDPVAETQALKELTRAGFASWQEIVKQNGYNPDEVLNEIKADQERFSQAGLLNDWTPTFEIQANVQLKKDAAANRPQNNNSTTKAQ